MKNLEPVMGRIPGNIMAMINDYRDDIETAWLKREGGENVTLNFSVRLGVKDGKNWCEVSIAFVKGEIKDKIRFTWDDKQLSLF
jgi:hypothetical protein